MIFSLYCNDFSLYIWLIFFAFSTFSFSNLSLFNLSNLSFSILSLSILSFSILSFSILSLSILSLSILSFSNWIFNSFDCSFCFFSLFFSFNSPIIVSFIFLLSSLLFFESFNFSKVSLSNNCASFLIFPLSSNISLLLILNILFWKEKIPLEEFPLENNELINSPLFGLLLVISEFDLYNDKSFKLFSFDLNIFWEITAPELLSPLFVSNSNFWGKVLLLSGITENKELLIFLFVLWVFIISDLFLPNFKSFKSPIISLLIEISKLLNSLFFLLFFEFNLFLLLSFIFISFSFLSLFISNISFFLFSIFLFCCILIFLSFSFTLLFSINFVLLVLFESINIFFLFSCDIFPISFLLKFKFLLRSLTSLVSALSLFIFIFSFLISLGKFKFGSTMEIVFFSLVNNISDGFFWASFL